LMVSRQQTAVASDSRVSMTWIRSVIRHSSRAEFVIGRQALSHQVWLTTEDKPFAERMTHKRVTTDGNSCAIMP